jgi:2-polyprenyl-3-methyl-5-hydroxy-6-metoxy-1,4-benzoquinol methylase
MIDLARKNNPAAEFQLMDCRDITDTGKLFDAVLCGFALPYLSKDEAIQLIHDSAKVLGSGGICYISTMEGNYADSRMQTGSTGDQLFMHYHEAGYLTDAFVQSGFSIQELVRKNNAAANDTDMVIIASKQ